MSVTGVMGMDQTIENIVIVGASHAGIAFADQMLRKGFTGSITLCDKEKGAPMERPPLSKKFLFDLNDEQPSAKFLLRGAKWYQDNNITLKDGCGVAAVDRDRKIAHLDDGSELEYDLLVLATGATPRQLPDLATAENAFVLRQPSDAIKLRDAAKSADQAVIIGGGYIGLEVAATLRQLGKTVHVLEVADRLLARVASPPIAAYLETVHQKHGVNIHTGVSINGYEMDDGKVSAIHLGDGAKIHADIVVVGIGVLPDSTLANVTGIETERPDGGAILVDEHYRTSDPNIMALGDVALVREGRPRVESIHNAQYSAKISVSALYGEALPSHQAPWFWSDQYDVQLQSVGLVPMPGDNVEFVTRPGSKENAFSVWSFVDDKLCSVETIRDPKTHMIAKRFMDSGALPTHDQVADPDFDLFKKTA